MEGREERESAIPFPKRDLSKPVPPAAQFSNSNQPLPGHFMIIFCYLLEKINVHAKKIFKLENSVFKIPFSALNIFSMLINSASDVQEDYLLRVGRQEEE